MKTTIILWIALLFGGNTIAQSTKEVIQSPRTASGKIFFDNKLKISLDPETISFEELAKSHVISIRKGPKSGLDLSPDKRSYTIYLQAYHPLHSSYNSTAKVIADSLNLRLNDAINTMIATLQSAGTEGGEEFIADDSDTGTSNKKGKTKQKADPCAETCPCNFNDKDLMTALKEVLEAIKANQNADKSVKWSAYTQELIDLDFKDQTQTTTTLKALEKKRDDAQRTYTGIYNSLDSLDTHINTLMNEKQPTKCALYLEVFKVKTDRIRKLADEQKKYLDTFEKLLKTVSDKVNKWESITQQNTWFIVVQKGNVTRDSSVVIELKLIEHKVSLENGAVKQAEAKETSSETIHLIWHRVFVPEVSAGVYYSFQEQPEYSMEDDGQGDGSVVQIGQKTYEKVTLSSMLNFYGNIHNCPVLPFMQVGLGIQRDLPLLMAGGGVRFGMGERTLSIAGGISITAIEGLNNLNIGDAVTDDAQIQRDLRYQFSGPKAYFGIQYHF